MEGGFSFDGIDIAEIGLEYVPENKDTYVYKEAQSNVHEQTFEGHDGGYYYGNTKQPKTFTLRCVFENKYILEGIVTKIEEVFPIGKTAKLIFKKRQWCWYNATVLSTDIDIMRSGLHGFVTIIMKAYYPFSRSDIFTLNGVNNQYLFENSGVLSHNETIPTRDLASVSIPLTSQKSFFLFNPGSRKADVVIEIAGDVGQGVIITNSTTNEKMSYVAITKALTTNVNKYIATDSLNGRTILTNGTSSVNGFLYHDYGFITLASSGSNIRDLRLHSNNNNVINIDSDHIVTNNVIGKYIYYSGQWYEILSVTNNKKFIINKVISGQNSFVSNIVKMNKLTVTPVSTMSLTRLSFIYYPTYA